MKPTPFINICRLVAMSIAVSAVLPVTGRTIETTDYVFDLDDTALTATLLEPMHDLDGAVSVPATIDDSGHTYTVTALADEALARLGHITSIALPNTITTLGSGSLATRGMLIKVNIPNSVTSIPANLFASTDVVSITIGSGLEEIPGGVLTGAGSLQEIIICDSDKALNISTGAFKDSNQENTKVSTIYMGRNITGDFNIGTTSRNVLTDFTIGPRVTELTVVPYSCNITELTLGENVESIAEGLFNLWPLRKLTLNNKIHSIGANAFPGLAEINVPDLETWLNIDFGSSLLGSWQGEPTKLMTGGQLLTEVIVPQSVTEIRDYAFTGYRLSRLVLHDGVKRIGKSAFSGCAATTVSLGSGIEEIDDSAFAGASFSSLPLPESLQRIGAGAFYKCIISDESLRVNAREIGAEAFYGHNIKTLTLGEAVTNVGAKAFCVETYTDQHTKTPIETLTIEDSPTAIYIAPDAFVADNDYFDVKTIYIGRNWNGNNFYNCRWLTELTFGGYVSDLNSGAFQIATSLEEVTIPATVSRMGDMFYRAPIKTLIFEDSPQPLECGRIGAIPYYETATPPGLTSLYLGRNVTVKPVATTTSFIGGDLQNVSGLILGPYVTHVNATAAESSSIFSYAYIPPKLSDKQKYNKLQAVHVPVGRWRAYRNDEQWSRFSNLDEYLQCEWVKPESITLSDPSIEGHKGDKASLIIEMAPANCVPNVEWTSSDPETATVDEYGNVSLIKMGECDITARSLFDPEVSATCHVKVLPVPLTDIIMSLKYQDNKTHKYTHIYDYLSPEEDFYVTSIDYYPSDADIQDCDITIEDPGEVVKVSESDACPNMLHFRTLKPGEFDVVLTSKDGSNMVKRYHYTIIEPVTSIKIGIPATCHVNSTEPFDITVSVEPENATFKEIYFKTSGNFSSSPIIERNGNTFTLRPENMDICAYTREIANCRPISTVHSIQIHKNWNNVAYYQLENGKNADGHIMYVQTGVETALEITSIPLGTYWDFSLTNPIRGISATFKKYSLLYGGYIVVNANKSIESLIGDNGYYATGVLVEANDLGGAKANIEMRILDHKPRLARSVSIVPLFNEETLHAGSEADLTVATVPENADNRHDLVWKSLNENVITIDQNGHIKVHKNGICTVRVSILSNGNDITADYTFHIQTSGIENVSVTPQPSSHVSIYTVGGMLIYEGEEMPQSQLHPGVYIVRHGSAPPIKLVVK